MSEDAHHIDEILRLYSEDLVPAIAKLTELKGSVQTILKEIESGTDAIKSRFFEGIHKGIRDHAESARTLTVSVEATRIELLGQQAELIKVAAESVGRDLKAAHDAILEHGYSIAIEAAKSASQKVLLPEVEKVVKAINALGQRVSEETLSASDRMADLVARAQIDVATFNWYRWLMIGCLVFAMSLVGTGIWRAVDNVWPWKLTAEQASALHLGQVVTDHWSTLDASSRKVIQGLLKGD